MAGSGPSNYFNPFEESFRTEPYGYYSSLREGSPRILPLRAPAVLVARYEDVSMVLRDTKNFSSRPRFPTPLTTEPFDGTPSITTSDAPLHTRFRKILGRAFSQKIVEELKAFAIATAATLVSRSVDHGGFDAIADLAEPLPAAVISHMLGISAVDYPMLRNWSDKVFSGVRDEFLTWMAAPMVNPTGPPSESKIPSADDGRLACDSLKNYFARELKVRKRRPGDGVIGLLAIASETDAAISHDEAIALAMSLLYAAGETVTNLIGNCLLALCQHPDQAALVRTDPQLIPGAIEEGLRYDSPVQMILRFAVGETRIRETVVTPGAVLVVMLAAANRDSSAFDSPEIYDVRRNPNRHLAFGEGAHFCLGAQIARLEAQIAIDSVLRRFTRMRLRVSPSSLSYKGSFVSRGLSSLPIEF